MSPAGVSPAWRPPLWLGLWGRLRCAPTPSHFCSQPIPSVRRPSFTFPVLVAVSSLADLGYLSRPSLPFVTLSLSKGLSTSSLVFLFPQYLFLVVPFWSTFVQSSRRLCIVTVPSFWIIPIYNNARPYDIFAPVDPHISRQLHHLEVVVQSLPRPPIAIQRLIIYTPPNITPLHLAPRNQLRPILHPNYSSASIQ